MERAGEKTPDKQTRENAVSYSQQKIGQKVLIGEKQYRKEEKNPLCRRRASVKGICAGCPKGGPGSRLAKGSFALNSREEARRCIAVSPEEREFLAGYATPINIRSRRWRSDTALYV